MNPNFNYYQNSELHNYSKCTVGDSSIGIALGYGLDNRGLRVRFQAGAVKFSLHYRVQNGSGAHPASYPMGTRALSLEVKRPGRETDHSSPSSGDQRISGAIPALPQYAFIARCSAKAQGQLYLYNLGQAMEKYRRRSH
jgi:hypothetical protein